MFNRIRFWLPSAAILFPVWALDAAALSPMDLRCEYETNPLDVDAPQPRLFWKLDSAERGQRQTAWHVLAASTPELLARDRGDLWDSGRVASDETTHLRYAGQPLKSSQQVFWKVRVWDQDARPSAWSQPASWTVGVLSPKDWQARWITRLETDTPSLEGAKWIWHDEPVWKSAARNLAKPNVFPGAVRFFQREFQVPASRVVRRARLIATADNAGELWLNGRPVVQLEDWQHAHSAEVTRHLRPGANLLAAQIKNEGSSPSEAGLILKLVMDLDDGSTVSVVSDDSWRTTDVRPGGDGWKQTSAPDWTIAAVVAAWGERYWAKKPKVSSTPLPLFRKPFEITQPIRRAVVHVCGLGQFDLFLDGRKAGDHFLDPAWSVFEKTAFYSTFDLTTQLRPGAHAFAVMLGKGFYNTAGDRRVHGVDASRPLKLILQAHLTFADGTERILVSDASWKTADGPITHSAILGGEDFDARKLPAGWDKPGFDDSAWTAANETSDPGGVLTAAMSPPLKAHDVFKPVRIDEPQPGKFVYDFGQNASAIPRLRVRGQAGQSLRLTPAEQRHGMSPRRNDGKGLVNPAGVGSPNFFQYTLRGDAEETWTPQFTYSGFQYLQLEGAVPAGRPNPDGKPVVEELLSVHVRNAAPAVGHFECSNPLFNDIDRIIDWAVRANLSHVLTDCPHREKLGWLEVSYLMGPAIAGRYDVARFYSKISRDCADSQRADGLVPTVAPAYPAFSGGFAYTPEWGAAAVVNPWLVHQWYGDRAALETSYATMKGFVDYMARTAKDLVPAPGLGDWYDYGHGKPVGASQFTPVELSAMASFHRCARLTADTAALLDRADDQKKYSELAGQIARAFNARYFNGADEYKNLGSPQAANSMALFTGMVRPDRESAVLERVVQDLRHRGNQQTAGDIAHWYLLQVLATRGRSDVIYDMTARTNLGSYGYIVRNGWTSMPEAWDANTGASMNHCMLGHIQEWFTGWVAGLRPDPAAPGFRRVIIQPHAVGDLTWARADYDSIRGKMVADWKKADGRFALRVQLPPNTMATVFLPAKSAEGIEEGGQSLPRAPGVRFVRMENGRAVLEVQSGSYRFTAPL
ncbi:MAG: family 78 glycoside hydrolase catalytic domain [Verrucomicrobia bacterium]|nr:family 78 glycoside hydrolase catalytic domain [Verrucomicrobiota bacterium]